MPFMRKGSVGSSRVGDSEGHQHLHYNIYNKNKILLYCACVSKQLR